MMLRDPFSSMTHLLFALWAVFAVAILVRIAHESRRPAIVVFGASMILLYLASGIFHAVPFTDKEAPSKFLFFKRIDQTAIFLLIAGTNTPMNVAFLRGRWRRRNLIGIWGFATVGITCLWIFANPPYEFIVGLFLAMGWLGFIPSIQYYRAVGWKGMNWALLGCLFYTTGAVLELVNWPVISRYPMRIAAHEIFHLFCMLASLSFFIFIARYAAGTEMNRRPATA